MPHIRFRVVCDADAASREAYGALAGELGIADRVDLPGYVEDGVLGRLFRGASVFFFPSLYEGFGLPVLDALACGVPVVASDRSSIPEVGGDHVLYCDPEDTVSMAAALTRAWGERDPFGERRMAAVRHARTFRWPGVADQYSLALRDAAAVSSAAAHPAPVRRPKIAYLSPWPPQRSGVADYSYRLMPELLRLLDVTLYTESPVESLPLAGLEIRDLADFPAQAADFENVIYHLGNSTEHIRIYEQAWTIPGVIVLHDFNIHPFFHHGFLRTPREDLYREALLTYGADAEEAWARYRKTGENPDVWRFPMCHPVARRSRALVVHSRWVAERLGDLPQVLRVHHGGDPGAPDEPTLRAPQLGMEDNYHWIGVFGFLNRHKRIGVVMEAVAELSRRGYPVRLLLVGEVNDKAVDLRQLAKKHQVSEMLRHEGYVSTQRFAEYLDAVDVVVNLRYPSMGESSGSMFAALARGKATLISDYAAFGEIPDSAAWKADPQHHEVPELVSCLEALLRSPSLRQALGRGGRAFIAAKADLARVALTYRDAVLR